MSIKNDLDVKKIASQAYDVIIVGAGPAGCSASYFMNEKGYKVLLLEKNSMPREKVCGDGLTPLSIRQFERMGVLEKIEAANPFKAKGVIISSPKEKLMNGKIPTIEGLADYSYILPRKKTDEIIFRHVASLPNVTAVENFKVKDVIRDGKKITGIKGRLGTDDFEIKGKYIIGADGPNSIISRKISLHNKDKKHLAFAARAYFEGVEEIEEAIEIHYEKTILPGYGWLFPTGKTTANVGVGIFCYHKDSKDLKNMFNTFISNNKHMKRKLKNATMVGVLRGAPLTMLSSPLKRSRENVLLTGDAGSFVDTITGEGIYYAMRTGELAAAAIHETNGTRSFPAQCFEKLIRKEFYFKETLPSKLLQPALAYESVVNMTVLMGTKSAKIASNLAGVIAHVIPKSRMMTKF